MVVYRENGFHAKSSDFLAITSFNLPARRAAEVYAPAGHWPAENEVLRLSVTASDRVEVARKTVFRSVLGSTPPDEPLENV